MAMAAKREKLVCKSTVSDVNLAIFPQYIKNIPSSIAMIFFKTVNRLV